MHQSFTPLPLVLIFPYEYLYKEVSYYGNSPKRGDH